jgi:hypothetical protein
MASNKASIDMFEDTDDQDLNIIATYSEWEDHITNAIDKRTHLVIHANNHIYTSLISDYERTNEGKRLVYLKNATVNGSPNPQNLNLDFVEITKLHPFGDKTPPHSVSLDDHHSFEVLNASYHNDQLRQVIENKNKDDRNNQSLLDISTTEWQNAQTQHRAKSSTPTDWAETIESDENLSPINPPNQSTNVPQIPITTTQTRKLPLLADGKTLDEEYLRLIWQIERPDITFPMWCGIMSVTSEMQSRNFLFGQSIQKQRLAVENPSEKKRLYQSWKDSFQTHFLPFDDWYKPELEIIQTQPLILNPAYPMNLTQIYNQAHDFLHRETDPMKLEHLKVQYRTWSAALIRKHNLPFSEWIKSNNSTTPSHNIHTQDVLTEPKLKPFLHLLTMDDKQLFDDYNELHNYIIDPADNNRLHNSRTIPTQQDFHPQGPYSNLHVPQYTHVPYGMLHRMKLSDLRKKTHIKHVIWSRLKTVQNSAYINNKPTYDRYIDTNNFNHLSPLVRAFRSQVIQGRKVDPELNSFHITQHINAHLWLKQEGGLQNVTAHAFYDMFIRPLEFLVTRGMTLHHQLLLACHNYIERHNLFRNIIELAGFQLSDPIPADVHQVFQELTRVRHLDPYALLDVEEHVTNPFHLLDAIPVTPDRPSRISFPKIYPINFSATGIYRHYKPSIFIPLPDEILNLFPSLSGSKISFSDHMRLHQEFCRQFAIFQKQQTHDQVTGNQTLTKFVTDQKLFSDITRPPPIPAHREQQEQQQQHASQPNRVQPTPTPPPRLQRPNVQSTTTTNEPSSSTTPAIQENYIWKNQNFQQIQSTPSQHSSEEEEEIPKQAPNLTNLQRIQTLQQFQQQAQYLLPQHQPQPQPQYQQTYKPQTAFQVQPNLPLETIQQPIRISIENHRQIQQEQHPHLLPTLIVPQIAQLSLDGATANNTEFFKPYWITDPQHSQEEPRTIFIGELLWPATNHYKTPRVAREERSAKSISENLNKEIAPTNHARYKTLPYFRQLPIDGAISYHNAKIGYTDTQHLGEQVFIEIEILPEKLTKKYTPISSRIIMPPHIFNRFTSLLHECSDVPLKPRVHDVVQNDDHLFNRSYRVANYQIIIDVRIARHIKGSDRYTFIRFINQKEPNTYPSSEISFPWFQTYEIVTACKSLHNELLENHLV